MISKGHHKHPKLARPSLGNFGRQEFAILGAPCNKIQALARDIIGQLGDQYHCAYVDASHINADADTTLPGMLAQGATLEYTDMIHHRALTSNQVWNQHKFRAVFNECDLVLVNGNHHPAAAQIVIIDPTKADSLKRRLDQLSNVRLLLLPNDQTEVYPFLMDALPNFLEIPRLNLTDTDGIMHFFAQEMQQNKPILNGLVLAGGQSLRMGRDKGALDWHGKPQREYLTELLAPVCSEVFISCRAEQQAEMPTGISTLPDTFSDLGPFGALLSAFRTQPDVAWLVVACDLPLLDSASVQFLVENRCVKKIATAFQSPSDQMPEPLIAIWEPKSYAVLLSFLAQGYSCPRKVLLQSDTEIIAAPNPAALENVNTPEELARMEAFRRS